MKLSELIAYISESITEYGDLDVAIYSNGSYDNTIELIFEEENDLKRVVVCNADDAELLTTNEDDFN